MHVMSNADNLSAHRLVMGESWLLVNMGELSHKNHAQGSPTKTVHQALHLLGGLSNGDAHPWPGVTSVRAAYFCLLLLTDPARSRV